MLLKLIMRRKKSLVQNTAPINPEWLSSEKFCCNYCWWTILFRYMFGLNAVSFHVYLNLEYPWFEMKGFLKLTKIQWYFSLNFYERLSFYEIDEVCLIFVNKLSIVQRKELMKENKLVREYTWKEIMEKNYGSGMILWTRMKIYGSNYEGTYGRKLRNLGKEFRKKLWGHSGRNWECNKMKLNKISWEKLGMEWEVYY